MARAIVKQVKNATLYDDGCLLIKGIRMSYPHVSKKYKGKNAGENAEPKYSLRSLMPKKTHAEAKELMKSEIERLIKESKLAIGKDNWCLKDGDRGVKPEEAGMYCFNSSEGRNRPIVRDAKAHTVTDPEEIDDIIVGGYWGNILCRLWVQNNDFGKKVNSSLIAIQFTKKDEQFGDGRVDDEDVFGDESGGEDGNGFDEPDNDDDL